MFAAVTSIGTPSGANAQLGGLIKKKIKETIQPTEKPAQPAAAPATGNSADAPTTTTTGSGLPAISGDVLVISPETIERVMRGIDSETAMIADFRKILAKYPTPQQYEECQSKAMLTPEGQKVALSMFNAPPNATSEQTRALIEKANLETQAIQKKACPRDPNDWTDHKRWERMEEIHAKAASMARPKPVPSSAASHDVGQKHLMFEVNPFDALPDTVIDTVKVIGAGGLSPAEYSILLERMAAYCEFKKSMDVSPRKGGLKAPGSGRDIYWVFREDELKALALLDCETFAKKYKSTWPT